MKKVVLSLAGVLAAVAFAPEASALPVFARQTGMACSACHFNHAPLLNGFGRAFKSAGYSMMGAQEKVEGENLSIPDRVNMAILTTTGYEKIHGGAPGASPGAWTVPSNGGELSLFMGGRIMDGSGFLAELGMGGAGAAVGAAKLLYMPEITSGTRLGVVFDTNNGQGVAHGFEILNTGAVNVHKIALGQTHINVYSAAQWLGTNNATTGVSVVGLNDMGFINVTAYDVAPQAMGTGASRMPLTYARAAATFDAAGFDMAAGVQRWMGVSDSQQFGAIQNGLNPLQPIAMVPGNYDATVIDLQAQGDLAGMSTGLYASYGSAPANSMFGAGDAGVAVANIFKSTTLNFGMDMNVGHELIARAALRKATNGADNLSDNAIMVGVIYELAQNFELHYTHTSQSGAHWNAVAGVTPLGKSTDSIVAEVLF
ncbi:MAG: hypothetical protein ABL873_07735 [Gallionella sp.]